MILFDTRMVLGDPYRQLETVCLIFLDEILISKVKRKIEPSNGQKCHDSDLKSPRYHKISSGSPRGHFYGLSCPHDVTRGNVCPGYVPKHEDD